MARTPNSKLQITLALDSKGLKSGMSRVSAETGRLSKSANRGSKATSALGASLRRAAVAAGGAALAYVSVAQARAAIQTTQDLALATAGLNRNLGISTKEASRWAAVTRARGVDSKTMTMSFTSLSRAIEGVGTGSESALKPFRDLGISQKELSATGGNFSKQVLLIADAFGEAEGSSTRQAAAQKLLGRGYQSLLPMFTEGSKGLQEQLKWADQFGATMGKDTVDAMGDFTTAQRKSKVALMGLQITFAKYATPAITDALEWVQKFVAVLNDPSLSKADKLATIRKQFRDLADSVLKILSDLGPEIAQTAGQLGVIMARSLAKAFVETGFLGKIAIGALLVRSLGGPAAIIAAGRGVGLMMSTGMASGMAAGDMYAFARSFGRGRGASALAAAGSSAAGTMALGLGKSLARMIPMAMAAVAIGDVVLTAIAGDMKGAAVKGGGAIIGGAIGAIFGPAGIAIGAGLGTIGAGIIRDIVGGAEEEAPKMRERIAASVKQLAAAAAREKGAYRQLASASSFVVNSRRRQKDATDRVRQAERSLARARTRFGPNSDQATAAARRLANAQREVAIQTQRARRAERVYGTVRKATKADLRAAVKDQKVELTNLRMKQQRLGRLVDSGKATTEQNRQYLNVSRQVDKGQRNLNQSYAEASQKVGPKFARSLQRIDGRSVSLRRAMARLKAGIKLNSQDMSRAYRNELQAMIRKTTDAANYLDSDGGIQVVQTGPGGASGAVPRKRRGGPISGGGKTVTAAVSPGEMISYRGREIMVPGRPEPRDSVLMNLPVGSKVFTRDGQMRLAMGSSEAQALRDQAPHFNEGGIVRPQMVGGIPAPRGVANKGFGVVHKKALAYYRRNAFSDLDSAVRLASKFGLDVSSGFRPGDDGWHGKDRARDFVGSASEMYKFADYIGSRFGKKLLELIYTPLGWAIKNGTRTAPYAAADHYDHVHVAMRGGGKIKANSPLKKKKRWGANALHTLAAAVGMPNPGLMAQVAQAESGGNAKLNNAGLNADGSVDYGLWQINSIHGKPVSGMLNPIQNAFYAREILNSQGIGAWSAYNNGRYSGFSPGRFDQEFFWDLIYSNAKQRKTKRAAKVKVGNVSALSKKFDKQGGGPGTGSRIKKAAASAKTALRLARKGNVAGSRAAAKRATKNANAARKGLNPPGRGNDRPTGNRPTGNRISDVSYLNLPASVRRSLSFEDRVALLERDLAVAGATATTTDDVAVLDEQIKLFRGLGKRSAATIARTSRRLSGFSDDELKKNRKKANAKGKSKDARKRRREGRAYLNKYARLTQKRSDAISSLGRAESELASARETRDELKGGGESETNLAEAMAELATAIREQNEIAKGVQATSSREAFRMLSDVISGQIVGKRISPSTTPQGVRY